MSPRDNASPALVLFLSLSSIAPGCAHTGALDQNEPAKVLAHEYDFRCSRATMGKFGPYRMPLADPVTDADSMSYLADFPVEARRAARAAGLEPLIVAILRDKRATGNEPSNRLLAMEEELSLRLMAFHTQLLAVGFEVHCTANRVDELLVGFERRQRNRQFALGISSLIAGATGTVAAGVWTAADPENARGPAFVAIGGGLATAGLGVLAIVRQDPVVKLKHEHNLLGPVWRGIDPDHLYPSFVFRMLTMAGAPDQEAPRAALVSTWSAQLDRVADLSRADAERTMYGPGGHYSRELADVRHQQFVSLGSALQAIGRDLELFNRYLVQRITPPPPSVPVPTPVLPPLPAPAPAPSR